MALGVRPDLIIGDFDSTGLPDTDIPILRYPSDKDDTDTMLAVKYALDRGYNDITIICALGGRMDHTYANISCLGLAASRNAVARIMSDSTQMFAFSDSAVCFDRKDGWSFSCFSLSEKCCNVSIEGAKFNASDVEISRTSTIGTSNTWYSDHITVSVGSGTLLVILSRLNNNEHI